MNLVKRDNEFWLTLGIFGELPAKETIEEILETPLDSIRRKDSQSLDSQETYDVATVRLAEWFGDVKGRKIFPEVVGVLKGVLPALNRLKKTYHCSVRISLCAFRYSDLGGVEFPEEFVRLLADEKIGFSILIRPRFQWPE